MISISIAFFPHINDIAWEISYDDADVFGSYSYSVLM
jgi:hypothetical protein